MKYSLAFLFVAATAILVTSAPPPSITVDTLNELLKAREDNQLLIDKTLHERQFAEPNFVPRDLSELILERANFEQKLTGLLTELREGQKARAAKMQINNGGVLYRKRCKAKKSGSTSYEVKEITLSPAKMEELKAKEFNIQALTVEEVNHLLSQLARNAAQRIQLARIAYQNGLPLDQIEELTHLRAEPNLSGLIDWTFEEISEDKLHYLREALRFFVSPIKYAFLPILARAGLCDLHAYVRNSNGVSDQDYIIAEKIFDSSSQILEYVLQSAAQAKLKYPTEIIN